MKKRLFFSLACCSILSFLSLSVLHAQTEKKLKTSVQRATLFQQGALLSATETISLSSGTTNIVFENVSPHVQVESIQATTKNDLIIMDVQYRLKYAETSKIETQANDPKVLRWQTELRAVQDSLDDLGFTKRDIDNRRQSLQTERQVLTSNRLMRGDLQRDSLALFMQSLDYLRRRQMDIDSELIKVEKEAFRENRLRTQLNQSLTRLNALIAGLGTPSDNTPTKPVPQIIVTVMAEQAMVADINLSYFVHAAGWTATYDLHASKETQSIDLKHRATVFQNTGIDWKDVLLTLSTGNPNQGNIKPNLTPQYLVFETPILIATESYKKEARISAAPALQNQNYMNQGSVGNAPLTDQAVQEAEKDGVMDYTEVTENMLRVEYQIKLKYSIASDNKPHNVVIQSKTMPAIYTYAVVPKLDPDAFLMARVTDWEEMNLIAGAARIYFDNSYIGESYINPRHTNDTLQLNLGRDKSIVVTRTKVKERSKDKSFSDNQVQTRAYDILVRNTKNLPIRIIVEDQMPVTKEQDIKIEYLENSGARFNPETGKLIWDLNLKPKDTKKLSFGYEVKSPKDKALNNL
jgi:uncharacterized protein (TIGR02231 family)